MKRPYIRREVIGFALIVGIVLGIVIDIMKQNAIITYEAEAHYDEPKEVLIETKIDWTEERKIQEIRNTFKETPNTAVAVAMSESGKTLKVDAYNPEWHYDKNGNKICQGSYGVMQIACVHHMSDPEALFDVEFNLQKAREIYLDGGWKPWGGYSSGGYKKYL